MEGHKPNILVIGIGGAGNNIITRLNKDGLLERVQTLGVDTNVQNLLNSASDKKLAIGASTKGLGAGKDPKIGEIAAKKSIKIIRDHINAEIVFLIAGLGGGTGTGSTPIISRIARNKGILTICICTLPFKVEGRKRMDFALVALEEITAVVDALIVIPNEKLLEMAPTSSLKDAFRIADELAVTALQGIIELVAKPGLINVDLADLRTLFSLSKKPTGISIIWRGKSKGTNRVKEAVQKAMEFPFITVDLSIATGAIINVTGSPDLSLQDAHKIVQYVTDKLNENAQVIWGLIIDKALTNTVKVTIVISGVEIIFDDFAE
ncbi:MAG: cell division protein FtsZ [Promethearchaeota archaeon]